MYNSIFFSLPLFIYIFYSQTKGISADERNAHDEQFFHRIQKKKEKEKKIIPANEGEAVTKGKR